ncbi:protein spaetzle 4 [Anopheles aquasalis]|uniref:protein spaetzle 4 n=1 Tax=Anopheles aquasalis TaxID=42839 RepID=UPI00215B49E5|nr:protein spaetzle 4 [Anopheles aquasalis]
MEIHRMLRPHNKQIWRLLVHVVMLCFLMFGPVATESYGYDSASSCDPTRASRRGRSQLLKTIPCDLSVQAYCNLPGSAYPWHAVRRFVHENQGLMRRMYGDVRHISVLKEEFENNEIDIDDIDRAAERYSQRPLDGKRRADGAKRMKYLRPSTASHYAETGGAHYLRDKNNEILYNEPHFRPAQQKTTSTTTTATTTTTTTTGTPATTTTTTTKPAMTTTTTTARSTASYTTGESPPPLSNLTTTEPNASSTERSVPLVTEDKQSSSDSHRQTSTVTPSSTISTSEKALDTKDVLIKTVDRLPTNMTTYSKEDPPSPLTSPESREPEAEKISSTLRLAVTAIKSPLVELKLADATTESDASTVLESTIVTNPNDRQVVDLTDGSGKFDGEGLGVVAIEASSKNAADTTVQPDLESSTTTTQQQHQQQQQQQKIRFESIKPHTAASAKKPVAEGQLFQDTAQKETPALNMRGVNACPVKEEVVAPFWANNTRGEVLALLNLYPFEQYVHWEKCTHELKQMYCREGCRCEQQYRLHRLLAYDPHNECRGIFSDWFRFPSCCICKCYDMPFDVRVTSRSPRSLTKESIEQIEGDLQNAIYEHATDEWYRPKDTEDEDHE